MVIALADCAWNKFFGLWWIVACAVVRNNPKVPQIGYCTVASGELDCIRNGRNGVLIQDMVQHYASESPVSIVACWTFSAALCSLALSQFVSFIVAS